MKKLGLVFVAIVLLFVAHVPVLGIVSKLASPKDTGFPELPDVSHSENYEMVRLFEGYQPGIRYDERSQEYVMIVSMVDGSDPGWSGSHAIRLDADGQLISRERIKQSEYEAFIAAVQGPLLQQEPERAYPPTYRMDEIEDVVKLTAFRLDSFSTWPYFYYFFPVVPFDWDATGFFELSHMGTVFQFRLPTDFYGGFAYLGSNKDLQLYYYRPITGTDVAFLAVAESSYSSPIDGPDIHRTGYGLYVLRPK